MKSNLNEILLNRKNLISVNPVTDSVDSFEKYLIAATASKKLESLGFRYTHDLIKKLRESSVEEILKIEEQILSNIEKRLGADVRYKPMYPGFPDTVMEKSEFELYLDAMIYVESGFTEMPLEYKMFKEDEKDKLLDVSKSIQQLKTISVGDEDDIKNIISNLMASSVAFSQNDKDDIITAEIEMENFESCIPEKIPNKENLTWLAAGYGQGAKTDMNPFLEKMVSATDVLRLVVAKNNGNTALTDNIRFKTLKKAECRMYAYQMAHTKNTETDISQRSETFKRMFKQYHFPTIYKSEKAEKEMNPREREKMLSISDKLYKNELPKSFDSKRNERMKNNDFNGLIELYKEAPGKLAKDMDWLISAAGQTARTPKQYETNINHLCSVLQLTVSRIDTNNLLKMQALISLRTEQKEYSVYATKKGLGNPYMKKDKREPIPVDVAGRINNIVDEHLKIKYAEKRPLGKVYIEESLKDVKIPSAQRTSSKGAQTLPYGSQIDLEKDTKTLRGFIWWTNVDVDHVDIDLSATFYDKNWNKLADLAYFNLHGSGYGVHSGDIRDGGTPGGNGVSEFIDMNLDNLKSKNVGYVVFLVNNFSEYEFAETPCKFGWMELTEKDKKIYDPTKVKTSVQLNTKSTRSIPVAFDVRNQKIIWMDRNPRSFCDFAVKDGYDKSSGNNTVTYASPIMVEAYKAVNLPAPSLYHLMMLHAEARGELVELPEEADTVFSLNRINDENMYPRMKENICSYDNDEILGDLLPIVLSWKDIEYFKALEEISEKHEETEVEEIA
ncbi:TerD family protein [Hungatella hathewayi]|uniref:TerD family protein n=1 Tax=Hungatella hathewayi TaxID=154046 RepID=UPI00356167D4